MSGADPAREGPGGVVSSHAREEWGLSPGYYWGDAEGGRRGVGWTLGVVGRGVVGSGGEGRGG